jgi:hypothetical protein
LQLRVNLIFPRLPGGLSATGMQASPLGRVIVIPHDSFSVDTPEKAAPAMILRRFGGREFPFSDATNTYEPASRKAS